MNNYIQAINRVLAKAINSTNKGIEEIKKEANN